jgi:uncharacterized protein YdhG (YjbR/CyaY superfamily)
MRKSSTSKPAQTIDEYLQRLPEKERAVLTKLRQTIKAAAPLAEELISYHIPSFKYHYMLVGFAAFKSHCSFFVMSASVLKPFSEDLSHFKTATGTIQFTVDKPIPATLIKKLVKARLEENEARLSAVSINKSVKVKAKSSKLVKKSNQSEDEVETYMEKLSGTQRKEINAVRAIVKNANAKLSERIKWNAPSYFYKQDIVTFGPYKTHNLLLVFHHPAVVKVKSKLLEGDYKDRRLVYFKDIADATKNKKELARIINEIIKSIDQKTN